MIQLLLSDLDETLLNDDGTINDENISAIKKFTDNGGFFVPNTGRSYTSVYPTLKTLGLDQKKQFVISYNGGAIAEVEPNGETKIIVQHGMQLDLAKTIFKLGQVQEDVDTHIYTLDKLFIHNISESDKKYMSERQVPYSEQLTDSLDFLNQEKPVMKVIFEHNDPIVRQKIADAVTSQVSQDVSLTFSSNRYVEFNPKGVDKGSTGLELAKLLGIDKQNVAAIGDSLNDLAQIEKAGVGVAVANAKEEIKLLADIVLKTTNNQAAVADFILNYSGISL